MERQKIDDLLQAEDQKLLWKFIITRTHEYLLTGYNGKLVIDFQQHRINSVGVQDFVVGVTQTSYHLDKFPQNFP